MAGWQHHEQFSVEQWQEWLDYDSEINVGFLTGAPSGLICLDIDNNEGMALLGKLGIQWKETWQYRTGRGLRVLYRKHGDCPTGIISKGDASLEVLGDGRQSVLPPSVHPNGRQYEWVVGRSPKTCECSDDTLWLEHLGSGNESLDEINSDDADWLAVLENPPRQGERNNRFASLAGHLMSPSGGMSEGETAFWLRLYNRALPEPLGESELASVVRSIRRAENHAIELGEREIRRLMVQYCLSHSDAKLMWKSMR